MTNFSEQTIFYKLLEDKLIAKNSEDEILCKKEKESYVIAIFGASGGTGKQLLEQALLSGHKVIAIVRNPSLLEQYKDKLEIRKVDLTDANSVHEAIKGSNVVVSTLGTGGLLEASKPTTLYSDSGRKILEAMKKLNIKRGLFVTSAGVEDGPQHKWVYRNILRPLFLMNTYMDMAKLETLVECSDIEWTLVRPPQLIDNVSNNFLAAERAYKTGTCTLSRTGVAKFIIHEIENNLWLKKHPALTY